VDRLIQLGILPEPRDGYKVSWPELTTQTEKDRAIIAVGRAKALLTGKQAGLILGMAPMDFFTKILGFSEQIAEQIEEVWEDYVKDHPEAEAALNPLSAAGGLAAAPGPGSEGGMHGLPDHGVIDSPPFGHHGEEQRGAGNFHGDDISLMT
jgi:hypothetical protein